MGVILRYRDFLKTYKTRGYRLNHLDKYKPLFPIRASPALAEIVADLICDGHLQGKPIWRADFTSKHISELEEFEKRLKALFKISGKIRKCKSNKFGETYNFGINCSPVARIFLLCGVPAGQKVITSFDIPNWIKKDKECFRSFCKGAFTCEGYVMHEKKRIIPQVRFGMWKSENLKESGEKFMRNIAKGMKKYFDIDSTLTFPKERNVRKDKIITSPMILYICGEKSVKNFYKEIGFANHKQQSLKAHLSKSN